MKKTLIILYFTFIVPIYILHAQILPPYSNYFDLPGSTSGWNHYAIYGHDDWQLGTPNKTNLRTAFSGSNAWTTNITGTSTPNSLMCLESPSFDLSALDKEYRIGFAHQYYHYDGSNVEYSIDNGLTWIVLNGNENEKREWYNYPSCPALNGQAGWSGPGQFRLSYHSLAFLKGNSNVKFRFKFGSGPNAMDGWTIDNFSIQENKPNIYAIEPKLMRATKRCADFPVDLTLVYSGVITNQFSNQVKYYWSSDIVFDIHDSLLGTKTELINSSLSWEAILPIPKNVSAGTYYIFYTLDTDNNLIEADETDNIGRGVLIIDSIYNAPLISNFDDGTSPWEKEGNKEWQLSPVNTNGFEGAHSGNFVWSSGKTATNHSNYLESPHLDLSHDDSISLSFWYRVKNDISGLYSTTIQYTLGCSTIKNDIANIPRMRDNTWDFFNVMLPAGANQDDVELRIYDGNEFLGSSGISMILDDIYVGKAAPDLSIERKTSQFTSADSNNGTLKYFLNNSGRSKVNSSQTSFYWSTDSTFDASDIFLGYNQEPSLTDTARIWRTFNYTKPTIVSGTYYILYFLDALNQVNEMREYNNFGYFTMHQNASFQVPYYNDFESQITGWDHAATVGSDQWKWRSPNGMLLNKAFSGNKVWVTGDGGSLSGRNLMHLYTPIFDFSTSAHPVMAFDMKLAALSNSEGHMNMSYSLDGGATWIILDTTNQSYSRWYYPMTYDSYGGRDLNYYMPNTSQILFDLSERTFAGTDQYNGRDAKRNTRYSIDLKFLAGKPNVRFRYNIATTEAGSALYPTEGAMIDNFSIKESSIDLLVEYKKTLYISSKNNKIKFLIDIKNNGNTISNISNIKYYVSKDTILDASDFYIGQEKLPQIRPDLSFNSTNSFSSPANFSQFNYLLYEIDADKTNSESNEVNNISYWNLGMNGISAFPYTNNFNDTIVNGWNQYLLSPAGVPVKQSFRFRNMLAPGEPTYSSGNTSGQMFTDQIDATMYPNWISFWYLESPTFDFSKLDTIALKFDLMCIGNPRTNGGNLDFSTDGGNTWTVLTEQYGSATNWYNLNDPLYYLNNQYGWREESFSLMPRFMDISFLKGQAHVVFRFKFNSNSRHYGTDSPQGMHIDNFTISGLSCDYKANDNAVTIDAYLNQPNIDLTYSITNTGDYKGKTTNTKFYWSQDPILDSKDILITTISTNSIQPGETINKSLTLQYPLPVNRQVSYILYKTDADNIIIELDESNNIGLYKIQFEPFVNYKIGSQSNIIQINETDDLINIDYSITNTGLVNGSDTYTGFYWSTDSLFDSNDLLIKNITEASILSLDTLKETSSINIPVHSNQSVYYIFSKADDQNTISEPDETDNIKRWKILVTLSPPISTEITDSFKSDFVKLYTNNKILFVGMSNPGNDNTYTMNIINSIGQIQFSKEITIEKGLNNFYLPNDLSSGLYLITINNTEKVFVLKYTTYD